MDGWHEIAAEPETGAEGDEEVGGKLRRTTRDSPDETDPREDGDGNVGEKKVSCMRLKDR